MSHQFAKGADQFQHDQGLEGAVLRFQQFLAEEQRLYGTCPPCVLQRLLCEAVTQYAEWHGDDAAQDLLFQMSDLLKQIPVETRLPGPVPGTLGRAH